MNRRRIIRRLAGLSVAASIMGHATVVAAYPWDPASVAFVQSPVEEVALSPRGIGNTILAGRYLQGMRVVTARLDDVEGSHQVVSGGFVCATDPVYHPDLTRLAFSGRRSTGDVLQIWELSGDDSEPLQLVATEEDSVHPIYLPDRRVAFASLLAGEYEEHGGAYSFSLYAVEPGIGRPVRLTYNPSSDFDPTLLPDGRILYASWQHVGNHHWPRGLTALMLINADGTGVFPFTGNHQGEWLKRGSRSLPDGRVAFIQSERFTDFGAGSVEAISLNDSFAPSATLVSSEQYLVSDVSPLENGEILLSARPADGSKATFGLYVYAEGKVRLLFDDPRYHDLAPVVAATTARGELRVSTVVPETPFGYLAILDCYESDRTDQHRLRRGSVKTVRVIEGLPLRRGARGGPTFFAAPKRGAEPLIRPNSATGYIPSRILGEVPPAPDGSVYLKVPADRPLRIQLVDGDGFTIVNERAWHWVRPNERRVCIGCHEDRELSPNNKTPLAVRRAPTDLTDSSAWKTVSFRKDIQPIVTQKCALADCHIPPDPTAAMNLSTHRLNGTKDPVLAERFGPAYANLLARQPDKPFGVGGRRVHPGDARSSPLLWMLYGRPLAPQFKPAPFERPMIEAHPGPMLPESLLERIRLWVDLGAPYDDESPTGPWPYESPDDAVVLERKTDEK